MFACLLTTSLLMGGRPHPVVVEKLGFVALEQRPSGEDLRCGNYSDKEWSVSLVGDELKVKGGASLLHADPLPFEVSRGKDRVGRRSTAKVEDGWLVGFDAGEFGGGLWWYSSDGRESVRVSPRSDSPANPDDIYRAENVRGLVPVGDKLLVLTGLDHLSGRSGRVFRAVQRDNRWELDPVGVLDASPAAWTLDGIRLLVLTGSGLWSVTMDAGVTQVHRSDIGGLYPNSLARGPDGALYVGMRRYVLRLDPAGDKWTETWLVSKECLRARIVGVECRCLP